MSPVWLLLLFYFWAVNPSRCFLCLYISSFYSFDCCLPFLLFFLSLCVAFVALVFLSGLYSAAYRAAFLAEPAEERISLCACLLFVSSVCAFVCFVCVSCGFIFNLSLLCPILATMSFANYFLFLSVHFCLLSCPAFLFFFFFLFRNCSRFDLIWFRLSCNHGRIRSGSVNVR